MSLSLLIERQPTRLELAEDVTVSPNVTLLRGRVLDTAKTISEGHQSTAQVTSHPIEDGSDVTDHIIQDPDELVLRVMISNTPIDLVEFVRTPPLSRPAESAYETLRQAKEAGATFTIITPLWTYRDMVLLEVPVQRDAASANVLDTTLRFRRIRKVKAVEVGELAPTAKTVRGKRQPKTAPAADTTKMQSLAAAFF